MGFYDNLIPLFNDAGWVKHANASVSADGSVLALNATAQFQHNYFEFTCTPFTNYDLTYAGGNGYLGVFKTDAATIVLGYSNVAGTRTFNSGASTRLRLYASNWTFYPGTFTFTAPILRKTAPASPYANRIPLFSDPAWSRHVNTTVSPDGLTLTLAATGNGQTSRVTIAATPLTKYRITGNVGGYRDLSNYPRIIVDDAGNGNPRFVLLNAAADGSFSVDFTTGVRTVDLYVYTSNLGTGTFTFRNLRLTPVQPTSPYSNRVPLFSDAAWTLAAGKTTVSPDGGTLTLNATGAAQLSTATLSVTPLTLYNLAATVAGAGGYVALSLKNAAGVTVQYLETPWPSRITTPANAVSAVITATSTGAGTFTFSNLSLTPVQPDNPYAEKVVNGGFDQGATGWTNQNMASFTAPTGKAVCQASAGFQYAYQFIDVTPLTTYVLKADVETNGGYVEVLDDTLGGSLVYTPSTPGSYAKEFTTKAVTRRVRIKMTCTGAGTFTFDNISLKRKQP